MFWTVTADEKQHRHIAAELLARLEYEGFSGGRPWAGVDEADRVIFEDLASQIRV